MKMKINKEDISMNNVVVSYEVAKKLQSLGFSTPTFHVYLEKDNLKMQVGLKNYLAITYPNKVNAPMFYQVFDWFRKEHDLFVMYNLLFEGRKFLFSIWYIGNVKEPYKVYGDLGEYPTYEKAQKWAIRNLVKIVNNRTS